MDQIEDQNLQTLTHYYNSSIDNHLLKKVTKLLVSVSVFSFCFSHSFLLSCNLFYFSKFPYQLFTHAIDKNCIFLLCNFLLVVLAKYSGLIRSLSKSYCININIHETFKINIIEGGSQYESPILLETEEPEFMHKELMGGYTGPAENVNAAEEKEEGYFLMNQVAKDAEKVVHEEYTEQTQEPESGVEVSSEDGILADEEDEQGNGVSSTEELNKNKNQVAKNAEKVADEEYKEQKQEPESGVEVSSEDGILADEEDEQGNGVSSTEELNKKFDEFIRKKKEELRIEAQQEVIMVQVL